MKNVVFIDPTYLCTMSDFNCGLLTIGSYLDVRGYKVDLFFSTQDLKVIEEKISEDTYYLGISSMTCQLPEALRVLKYFKSKFPHLKVIFGGYHAVLYPQQTIEHPLIDFICTRDGEELCLELIEALEGKREISQIQGLGYKNKGGEVVINPDRPDTDINCLPQLNYELIHNFKPFVRKHENGKRVKTALVYSGKGCPFVCTFCVNSLIKRKWQGRDLKHIFAEIEWLIREHGVNDIILVDELFFVRRERFFQWLDEIEKRNLKFSWFAHCRVGYINENYLSLEVLKRMKRLGCELIGMGVESGSQRMIDEMKKGITLDQALHAVNLLNQAEIIPKASFIIGMPDETAEDMLKTFKLIRKMHELAPRFHLAGPFIYRPYPGGVMYDDLVESGLYEPESRLEDWFFGGAAWNDRARLQNTPWLMEKDLACDIKDVLQAFVLFKNEPQFKLARTVLKRIYNFDRLIKFCLTHLPHLDPSAKTIFRPDLEQIYQELIERAESIDLFEKT